MRVFFQKSDSRSQVCEFIRCCNQVLVANQELQSVISFFGYPRGTECVKDFETLQWVNLVNNSRG